MLLAIDVGNTNIVLGVFEGDRLVESWRLATDNKRSADEYGTIICRELLGVDGAQKPDPTPRNPEFYKTRPCLAFVASAARALSEFIQQNT